MAHVFFLLDITVRDSTVECTVAELPFLRVFACLSPAFFIECAGVSLYSQITCTECSTALLFLTCFEL